MTIPLALLVIALSLPQSAKGQNPSLNHGAATTGQTFQTDLGAEHPYLSPAAPSSGTANPAAPTANGEASTGPAGFDSGNDPTIVRKRLTFRSEYNRFRDGLAINTTTVQATFPILQEDQLKVNFGLDLPFNYYEVENPVNVVLSGLGDFKMQLTGIKTLDERMTFLFGSNLWLPTAEQQLLELPDLQNYTNVDLGTGKFRVEPLVGTVIFINPQLFVVPVYAHDMSFAGKPDLPTINRGTARIFINRTLEKGWYFSSETQALVNYANDNDVDAMQKFELGRAFRNGTVFYTKPGIGIAPDSFNREWAMELGLRFVF